VRNHVPPQIRGRGVQTVGRIVSYRYRSRVLATSSHVLVTRI
jgi:hypothetical protein